MALNGYAVYITDQTDKKTIELPVNPAAVKLAYETDDQQETVINLGEVNNVGKLKLTSLSIESLFPTRQTTYTSSDEFHEPDTYIKWFKNIQSKQHKVRVVITGTKISVLMTIQKFEYGMSGGNVDEYQYTLTFLQYRKWDYKKLKKKSKKGHKKSRSTPPKKIGIGSTVKVNGRLHLDSYGRAPGQYEKNAKRQVLYIVPGRKYPVCVGINGIARGWVKQSEVKRV